MKWNNASETLPQDGERVLAWDGNYHVVTFRRGISLKEREQLPDTDERKRTYYTYDEGCNNQRPYSWKGECHLEIFGQDIRAWASLAPEDEAIKALEPQPLGEEFIPSILETIRVL